MTQDHDDVLLTASTVRQWEQEGADIDAQITDLQMRRDSITRRLEAVKFLFGQQKLAHPPTPVIAIEDDETMVDAVIRVLREADRPLDNTEIRAKLAEKPKFRESLDNNVNYYYTLMNRLLKKEGAERVAKLDNGYVLSKGGSASNLFD